MEVERVTTYYTMPSIAGGSGDAGKRLKAFSGPILQQGSGFLGDVYRRYLRPAIRRSVIPRSLEMAGAIAGDLAESSSSPLYSRHRRSMRQMLERHGKQAASNIVFDLGKRIANGGSGAGRKPRKKRTATSAGKSALSKKRRRVSAKKKKTGKKNVGKKTVRSRNKSDDGRLTSTAILLYFSNRKKI